MSKLFFLLSGEHPTLPASELRAILEAEGYRFRVLETLTQLLRLDAPLDAVQPIAGRAALTRICGLELLYCNSSLQEIMRGVRSIPLEDYVEPGETFVVRIRRVRGSARSLSRTMLERKIGEVILEEVSGLRVDLFHPEKTFFGVLTDEKFVFGLKLAEIQPKPFVNRMPHKKPFFHPAAMPPKLARCMVNLARPRRGDLILDPFCGTAGILIEAGLIGCRVLGFDVKRHMAAGGLRNLLYYGVKPEGMLVADARKPPILRADRIVTDPPYGRSASTLGLTTREIVWRMLSWVGDVLPEGGMVCLASPKTLGIGELGVAAGLEHVESHFVYVHGSLTREIAVFRCG